MTDESTRTALWTRREAIRRASALLGGMTLVGQAAMLAGCDESRPPAANGEPATDRGLFSDADVELLTEVAETILPATDTPGAKAAGVGPFIALMVTDCYSPDEQATFRDGLATIDELCRETYGQNFVALGPDEQLSVAERLDREQFESMQRGGNGMRHYFRMLKELTVLGYFTSEVAYSEVLDYAETPGRYEPCRELGPDVRMLADHGSSVS
ncbi:MAG: gluconate 2-dehydrogenase subunit 3 family protein [Woeseiaceae bacterium]|nr:gluconate 2-dehydrogenase subunit 3 family protein [Woeseiaceae bacterium]